MYNHQQPGYRWSDAFYNKNDLARDSTRYIAPYQSAGEVARIFPVMSSQPGQEAFAFDHGEHPDPEKTAPFAVALLALSEIEGLGRKSLIALVKAYGEDLGQVWKESQSRVYEVLSGARIPAAKDVAKAILNDPVTSMSKGKAQYLALAERRVYVLGPSEMPGSLQQMPDSPPWLFVQGTVQALFEEPFVAVVGTRKPTERGRIAADIVSRQLAAYPITLVSGLAEGIDEHAHSASLR